VSNVTESLVLLTICVIPSIFDSSLMYTKMVFVVAVDFFFIQELLIWPLLMNSVFSYLMMGPVFILNLCILLCAHDLCEL
jgi:hypothetical protein